MINLVLSGGSGTRLWPISREQFPKQFAPLFTGMSLFQKTVQRNQALCQKTLVVCNESHYFVARDQLHDLSNNSLNIQFLLEPCARNTAPAIALACLTLAEDELVLVTPSDHLIENGVAYEAAVKSAKLLAQQNQLVTFGVPPHSPDTGFGYLQTDGDTVLSFKEKPCKASAEAYLKQGNYLWNSGLFCFKAGLFLEELQQHAPDIYQACLQAFSEMNATKSNPLEKRDYLRVPLSAMQAIPAESIDYAVMEKSRRVKVISTDMKWQDLGSFEALSAEFKTDKHKNTLNDNNILIDAHNNFIFNDQRLISLIDVDDLMVIDTADALLIARKGAGQKIRKVVETLKQRNSELPNSHQTVHRPWGTYTVLESAEHYKIKRLVVHAGKSLSLQSHQHRSEHWIVISGTATVTIGEQILSVFPNQSTYIPIGEKHRLANQTTAPLTLIEAQVGETISESDIQRFSEY